MNNTVIKLRDISKKRGQTEILNHLNMTVYQNDIYGFIGQNGAGKSTTMKIIMSLIKETQGQLELFDSLDNQINRSRIGAIIENPAFYPYMTAYENLKYYVQYKGIVEINSIEKVLKMVGLENARKKKYKNYSLGMKQRLGLALALINNPDLLILDEPLNGLDPTGISELRSLLKKLNTENNITIILSSHILSELHKLATCYGIMHKGRIIEEISSEILDDRCKKHISIKVSDIKATSMILEKDLGINNFSVCSEDIIKIYGNFDKCAQINKTLVLNNILVEEITIKGESLESYFTKVIGGELYA